MNTQTTLLRITRTAVMLALLVAVQALLSQFGIQLLTGSAVNLLLILSVVGGGLFSGVTVALVSPFVAKLFGIGPLWELIPLIALGNLVLILVWHFWAKTVAHKKGVAQYALATVAAVAAAVVKFVVLYASIVKLALPLLQLPAKQAAVISATFGVTQLFTALIGGLIAVAIFPQVVQIAKR